MPVLRMAVEHEPHPTRPVAWEDVRREAARLVEEARAEAARILAQARAEGEAAKAAARTALEQEAAEMRARLPELERKAVDEARAAWEARALEEGRPRIEARLEEETGHLRALLASLSAELQALPGRLAASSESQTVRLAVETAELLVRRELKTDPSLVSASVRAALESMAVAGAVTVRLHPDDKARLERDLPRLLEGLALAHPVVLEADPTVAAGGCRAFAAGASADASLEGQLRQVRKALLGEEAP